MLVFSMVRQVHAQNAPEHQLKAALIYNFMLFTEWPAGSIASNEPITLCAYKSAALGEFLLQLQHKPVGSHELRISLLSESDSLQACQALYLDMGERLRSAQIRKKWEGLTILSISDRPNAIDEGAMIAIAIDNNRFVFEVNASAARQSGLAISSKLLRLASKVW